MKGQSSMAAIAIAIVLLVFLMVFMFTMAFPSVDQNLRGEYRKLFSTNALLSVLNTETECGKFSDMLKAQYFGGGKCGDGAFASRIEGYMDGILMLSGHTDYDWLMEATPKSFSGTTTSWGDETVTDTNGYWGSTTILTWGGAQLEVKLYIRTR